MLKSGAHHLRLSKRRKDSNWKKAMKLFSLQPSIEEAVEAGIIDQSYKGTSQLVHSYRGQVELTNSHGKWRAIGHGPTGTPRDLHSHGFIEFIPLELY